VYEVRFYQGDYRERQRRANADQAKAYVEHHFNSSTSPTASYAVVITGSNASQTSRDWGRWYAQAIGREFGVEVGGDQGIKVGGYDGRGDDNLRHTNMPAILLEPLFVSNPAHAAIVRSEDGQMRIGAGPCRQHQEVLSDRRADRIQRRPQVQDVEPRRSRRGRCRRRLRG
jgi:N-acetylmuramoyl-L-alanine amidase